MPKTKADKAAEKLYQESLEKKRDQANTIETIHQILNGRFHSVIKDIQEKEHQAMSGSKGKFFGTPKISPHCETPQLDEKPEDVVPSGESQDLHDGGGHTRASQ